MSNSTTSLIPSQIPRYPNSSSPIHIPSPTHLQPHAAQANHIVGHDITTKTPDNIRLILQNPNGVSSENNYFEYQLLLHNMKSVDSDIILLPETNLCWSRYNVIMPTTKHRKNLFRFSKQVTSNSQRSYNTPYQPGGTATIITNNVVGRFHSSLSDDSLGRWSIVNLTLNSGQLLSIVCCYQVCEQHRHTAGPKTAYNQQWSILKEQGYVHPNPRKQFYHDLDHTLSTLTNQGNLIILSGDFNCTIGEDPTGLDRLLIKYRLIDPIQHHHGPYHCPTYARGSKCIDYILVSHALLPAIQRSGIMPFDSITNLDHRPVFIDMSPQLSFGNPLANLVTPPNRRLFSNNPTRKEKYISHLFQLLSRHNVFSRIAILNSLHTADHDSIALCESIDRDVTRYMISAENQLRQPSSTPFSSVLSQACIKVSILKSHILHLQHHSNKTATIQRLQQKLPEPLTLPTSLPQSRRELRQARQLVRQLRKDAIAQRDIFLQALIQQQPSNKLLKHIRRTEEMKRGFAKIRYATKPTQHSLVTQLDIPSDNLPPKQSKVWTRITDPHKVTSSLIERNTSHFGSAHGSPFTIPPISYDFDWQLHNSHYQHTLNGCPPQYNQPLVDKLLSHLKQKVSPTKSELSLHDLVSRFRKWSESTTTSPSRRHLGHYKSLLPDHNYDPNEYTSSPEGQILLVHLSLLNFCARTGYSLQRWHNIITTMIPKEANNYKIHRLRVIHIYEADLTALFSIWSRRMIYASSSSQSLNPGSYGARPGRTSTDPPLIALLQNEISAITRTSLCIGPNDASQCYDRLIPNQALLSCMSHGMPTSAAKCIGATLFNAKYYLRTSTSQSASYWSHTPLTPVYGTGQGSGISPGICCVVYSDLFDVHSTVSPGSVYTSPDLTNKVSISNIGFVDDTTTTITDHGCNNSVTPTKLITSLQSSLQSWADILHVSGGALELTKTSAYLLFWLFRENGSPFLADSSQRTITLRRHDNTQYTIPITPASVSFKILGFHLSPNQDMSSQYQILLDKSHHLSLSISGSSVDHREAYLAYFSVFLPAISYVLPLTTFSEAQCHRLQVIPTKLFLQKCGFVSTMKRAIVFGSRQSGGLGFRHPYTEQGIAHIVKIFQTLRTPGQSQHLLLICIHEWQLNSGMSFPLLEFPKRPCPHLEGQWLLSTRQFLSSLNASITLTKSYTLPHLREHDQHIMDVLVSTTKFSTRRMSRLNYCRLFLQITLLSEITNQTGTHLIPDFWSGTGPRPAPPLARYPRQGCPSSKVWSEWRSAIRQAFCYPRSCRLRQPLGQWFPSKYYSQRFPSLPPAPPDAHPSQSTWQSHLLHHLTTTISQTTIKYLLHHPTDPISLICASDGGATHTSAAFGWVICNGPRVLATCYGPVHGYQPTAYRAECYGALSLLLYLSRILSSHDLVPINIYIDNLSLVKIMQRYQGHPLHSPSHAVSPERDVLLQIEHFLIRLPSSIHIHHIKSHQDRQTPSAQLSYPAKANCIADSLATQGLHTTVSLPQVSIFDESRCHLHIDNLTITHHLPHHIRHFAHLKALRNHILQSRNWSATSSIDWQFFGRLCLRHSHRIAFYLKWIHLILPTGSVLHKRSPLESPFCPACGVQETNDHLLLCRHPSRKAGYISLMSNLRRSLLDYHDPTLADILINGTNSVLSGSPIQIQRYPAKYHNLITQQSSLGWINFLRGFVTIEWTSVEQSSSKFHPAKPTILSCLPTLWSSIFQIWSFRCDQRHSKSLQHHESELRRQALLQVTNLYSLRQRVLPTDRHIFYSDMSAHLTESTSNLQAWLANHQPYLHQSVLQAQQQHITHTRSISSYFALS